jgi:hypothetical protein
MHRMVLEAVIKRSRRYLGITPQRTTLPERSYPNPRHYGRAQGLGCVDSRDSEAKMLVLSFPDLLGIIWLTVYN